MLWQQYSQGIDPPYNSESGGVWAIQRNFTVCIYFSNQDRKLLDLKISGCVGTGPGVKQTSFLASSHFPSNFLCCSVNWYWRLDLH